MLGKFRRKNSADKKKGSSPETGQANPVLAKVFHISNLGKQLADLVLSMEFLMLLEVMSCQLLFDLGRTSRAREF